MAFDSLEHDKGYDVTSGKKKRSHGLLIKIVIALVIIALLAGFIVCLVLLLTDDDDSDDSGTKVITDENTGEEAEKDGIYRYAAIATNTELCSKVGVDIMAKKGGSAVDAAIATITCVGVVRFHSSGVGGDTFWTFYDREKQEVHSIMARSMAPLNSNSTMFVNNTDALVEGGMSVCVPGEVMAFWKAHQRLGRLPWADLFQPAIKMAEEGFPVEPTNAAAIKSKTDDGTVQRYPELKAVLTNPKTGTWYKEGEIIRLPKLAATLRIIAQGGADVFYNGTLADAMVTEIQNAGGIITKEDFARYFADEDTKPLKISLHGNLTLYSPPLPSGGPVLQYILNILSGYKLSPADVSTRERQILNYHRHVEAFKHAYASRSKLGSPYGETPEFQQEMEELVANITNLAQGEAIRSRISDTQTFPWQDYNPSFQIDEDAGTSQISVLAPNGDAVSVTSTINYFFGSKIMGNVTGISYNNMMDDFSTPGVNSGFNVPPSPANFIQPLKRPLSSMTPSILLDQNGDVALVVGAAGGTRITTTAALLTSLTLWSGYDMKQAIDAPRVHHQLLPDEVAITRDRPQWLVEGLEKLGHKIAAGGSLSSPNGVLARDGLYYVDAQGSKVDGL